MPHRSYLLVALPALAAGIISCGSEPTQPAPAHLAFIVQPSATTDGHVIATVQVAVLDASGNALGASTDEVTLALGANSDTATLSGTLTVAAAHGIATFSDLRISRPGGYTLTANAPGTTGASSGPFAITLAFTTVSPGERHTCGVTTDGAAYCWGDNYDGQLGTGTANSIDVLTPAAVGGGLSFTAMAAGFRRTCGITTGGVAYCWGYNGSGELGDGTMTSQVLPAAVTGGLTFAVVSATSSHSCGVTTEGAAYCWGDNLYGQLGDGTTTPRARPTAVLGGLTFSSVTTGYAHTCGITTGGVAYCWGYNGSGELGDGGTIDRPIPQAVAGGLTFIAVSAGSYHTCGVRDSGAAYCWGQNASSELGDGTTIRRTSPVEVRGGLTFHTVSAGSAHNCGLTTDGMVYCWGRNAVGELGDETRITRSSPVLVRTLVTAGLTAAVVRAGAFHTCVVTTESAAYCWGQNMNGQVGDGTPTDRSAPVRVTFRR